MSLSGDVLRLEKLALKRGLAKTQTIGSIWYLADEDATPAEIEQARNDQFTKHGVNLWSDEYKPLLAKSTSLSDFKSKLEQRHLELLEIRIAVLKPLKDYEAKA